MSLGTYDFAAGTTGSVTIRNDAATGYVVADGIQFVSASGGVGVSVLASASRTLEGSTAPGVFTVLRDSIGTLPLTVRLTFSGSATGGTDYKSLPPTVTIPAGRATASLSVFAFADSRIEPNQTVTANIAADPAYHAIIPSAATVFIDDPASDQWKSANFSASEIGNPAISSDNADPDGDGLSNLMERALGRDPRRADANAIADLQSEPAGAGRRLILFYSKSAADLRFEVQQLSSLGLGSWSHLGVSGELYDARRGLFYQYLTTTPDESAKFLRLQITSP
jgi:hypothetical protein